MKPYLAYIRSSLLGMLAYRLRYVTGILTYLLYVSIHYFIWRAVFGGGAGVDPGRVINGFTFPEMITYITVAWIARSLYFNNVDYEIDDIVKTGQISVYLLRPVDFQGLMLSQAIGETGFRLIFFTLPIALVVLDIFPVMLPATLLHGLTFFLATLIGFLIMAELNFIVGLAAIYFKSISSFLQAKHYLLQLLSGLLLPISFFPHWAAQLLQALPFQMITYVPLQMYLGKIPYATLPGVFAQQIIWLVVLHVLGALMWQRATRFLVVQGG